MDTRSLGASAEAEFKPLSKGGELTASQRAKQTEEEIEGWLNPSVRSSMLIVQVAF